MINEQFFILTGAPGSGKSRLLQHLAGLGFQSVAEPARQILAEQRSIDGNGLPGRDTRLFVDLMLSRAMHEYARLEAAAAPVFFDRGIPDMLGYAAHFGFEYPPGQNAARNYRYNRRVFFAPAWEEIYAPDEERTISFQVAAEFGHMLRAIYEQLGYEMIDIPLLPVEARAAFMLRYL